MNSEPFDARIEFVADEEIYRRVLVDTVLNAQRLVRIATANVKDVHLRERGGSLLKQLAAFVRKGGELHLLHSGIPSRRFLTTLKKTGLTSQPGFTMKRCIRVHLKTALVDGRTVFIGSPNFTGAGLGAKSQKRRNFEIGLLSDDQGLFDLVEARYDEIWSGHLCEACDRRAICYVPLEEPHFDDEMR